MSRARHNFDCNSITHYPEPCSCDLALGSEPPIVEHPILFSTSMVKAILDGKKSQTRRLVKRTGEMACSSVFDAVNEFDTLTPVPGACPYGVAGHQLWVRETWSVDSQADLESKNPDKVWFKASEKNPEMFPRWRPSIHMPRWASRLDLRVTDVRVERLQDISAKDARAEGIEYVAGSHGYLDYSKDDDNFVFSDPRDSYRTLWDKINGNGSWATNPWVWAVSFKRIK